MNLHQTIRVFISSTFKDMHTERDYLVKYVFPELRERCLRKGIHLVDIDLRWGVTEKEAEEGKALAICLDEIENCRPFFIGILGERYGWTPNHYDLPNDKRYDWIKSLENGYSITALEIYQGIINNPQMQPRAFFYFRDSDFIKDVPVAKQDDVKSENHESAIKLKLLKEKIKQTFLSNTYDYHITEGYKCAYKGLKINWSRIKDDIKSKLNSEDVKELDKLTLKDNIITNKEYELLSPDLKEIINRYSVVYLSNLEEFGNKVQEQLWQAIEEMYPLDESENDPLQIENKYHENVIDQITRIFVGRNHLISGINNFIQGKNDQPLFINGRSGSGKSALLAKIFQIYKNENPDAVCIARFIGASPASKNILKLIENLIQQLGVELGFIPDTSRFSRSDDLWKYFKEVLLDKTKSIKILLIIDAIDQLNPTALPYLLTWLPNSLPNNVKIIISSKGGDFTKTAEYRKLPFITIDELNKRDSKEIIETKLGAFRKSLSEIQMSRLLEKEEATNPLYLSIACEELRTFAIFEEIDSLISGLAPDVPGLFEQVLEKLEKDHGQKLVKDALCYIETSNQGLSEDELLDLLKRDNEEKLPANIWTRLYRNISPYLNNSGENKEGLLHFFHQQLSDAVQIRYLNNAEVIRDYNIKLANYAYLCYKKFPDLVSNTLRFAGIYIYKSGDYDGLKNFFEYYFSGKVYFSDYEIIFNELIDYISDHYKSSDEKLLLNVLQSVKVQQIELFCNFLIKKGIQFKNTGKSNWALECLKTASTSIEKWTIEAPYIVNYKYSLVIALNETGILMFNMGLKDQAQAIFDKSANVINELVDIAPDNLDFQREQSVNYNNIGKTMLTEDKPEEALIMFEKSLMLRKLLLQKDSGSNSLLLDIAVCYSNIGNAYENLNNWNEAEIFYIKDIEIMEQLLQLDPENSTYVREASITLSRLATTNITLGNYQKAISFSKESIKLIEQALIYSPQRTDLLLTLSKKINNLGTIYQEINDEVKAMKEFKKGYEINQKLVEKDPERIDYLNELAKNQYKIFQTSPANEAMGWLINAFNTIQKFIPKETEIASKDEIITRVYHDLGRVFSLRANHLISENKTKEAFEQYLKSNSLLEILDFTDSGYRETAETYLNNNISIAKIFANSDNFDEAINYYIKAENILAGTILQFDPENLKLQYTQASIYSSAGKLYIRIQDFNNALVMLRNAIVIYESLLDKTNDNSALFLNLFNDYYQAGTIYAYTEQTEQAYSGYKNSAYFLLKAHALDPDNIDHWRNLGTLYWNISSFCPSNEKVTWLIRSKETFLAILSKNSDDESALDLLSMVIEELNKNNGHT
jgi:tetratricopeptide (TPR) repeat protein